MALNLSSKSWIAWLLCGTALGILIMVLFGKGCIAPKPISHNIYHSDTVHVPYAQYVHDTVNVPYETILPEKVTIYDPPDTPLIAEVADSGDLAHALGYNPNFLWQFRDRPKFIKGSFIQDSITLQLLDTSGRIIVSRYPVEYPYYNYLFTGSTLVRVNKPIPKPVDAIAIPDITKQFKTTGNIYGYYSLTRGGFTMAADYWVLKGKWGIGAIGELNSYPTYGNIKIGAKYQFK